MRAIAIGWQGAVVGNLLVVALFLYRNSPFMWGIIATITAMQGLLTVWVLVRQRNAPEGDSDSALSNAPNAVGSFSSERDNLDAGLEALPIL